MPNWVKNYLKVNTANISTINTIADFVRGEEDGSINVFDFEKVIPTPMDISDVYNWHINQWGTKWNSSRAESVDGQTIMFETAWTPPIPVIKHLSELFPDIEFNHIWADEDFGYRFGAALIKDGRYYCHRLPKEGSPRAVKFAKAVWDYEDKDNPADVFKLKEISS